MSNIGNLSFSVHLQDMTDADIAKIKQKLQNLSLSLNIDGNNIKVSNADVIKKQIENAVKSVMLPSVKIDTSAVKQQIEASTQGVVPQIRVSLLKDNLTSDIQSYLNTKSFDVKISVLKTDVSNALKNIGTVTVPVSLKVDKKIALDGLKKSLLNMSVPIGVRMKSSKDLVKDIQERMKNTSVKVGIDVNKNVLRSNVTQALKGQTFKANLDLVVQKASVQQTIRAAFAQAGLKYNTTASDARQNLIDTRTMKASAYADAQKALADLRRAQLASSQAANQQGNSMQRVTEVAERQKGVFATLRENVANAYAVYRVGRFLNTAMRIGGEFQQQHIALQTIIGDADKANALFERIKNLAVESPFKMLDLSKYTKQLAAFSIPYEELYDTLKRFGDLSAGLGVDMGRIILAYGQVRSAELLKGTELRQFTEAGIPLVTELAKKYTELRGTLVSVGDVYDMISKKQVTFADVKDVLWNMTSEGGKFFNMQAELTDTLKGKLDKLADSYEIFLSEIANSNNDVLGGTLDLLANTLKHWNTIQDVIQGLVVSYGSYKAAVIAVAAIEKARLALNTIQYTINLARAMQGLTAVTKMQAIAQAGLNAVMSANPFVLAATVIGSLVGLFITFRGETESEADAMARLSSEMQEAKDNMAQQEREASKLVSVMANEKRSIEERNAAYDQLREMYGLLFPNMTREQVLMLDELKIRNRVSDKIREQYKEQLKLNVAKAQENLNTAQSNYDKKVQQWEEDPKNKIRGRKMDTPAINAAKAELEKQKNLFAEAKKYYDEIIEEEKIADEARKERWYVESSEIANAANQISLAPSKDEVDRWAYFDRVKQIIDDIQSKIKSLDPKSASYSELFPSLDAELKAAKNIYYNVLGGRNEEVLKAAEEARKQREKALEEEAKRNKKAGEEAIKAYYDGVQKGLADIADKWDLYKQLFELTGDKKFASTAFTITPVWDEAAKEMAEKFKQAALVEDIDWNMSDSDAKKEFGELYDAWKEIKDRIEKNGVNIKVNAAKAYSETMNLQEKLESLTTQRDEELKQYAKGSDDYNRVLESWSSKIREVQGEIFVLSPEFKKLLVDTTAMGVTEITKLYNKAVALKTYIDQNRTKSVENNNKEVIGYEYKKEDGTIGYIPIDAYEKLGEVIDKTKKKASEVQIAFKELWAWILGKDENKDGEKDKKFIDIADSLSVLAKEAANTASALSSMFDSLGEESAADVASFTGDMLNSVSQIGEGIASGNPLAVISGIANGISSIAQYHDKKLDRAIQKSQLEVQKLSNEYKNLETTLERQLGSATAGQAAKMMESLKKQRTELQKQYEAEDDKKKTDKSKLEDYKQQMTELDDQIKHFYDDLANEQYGVDIKGWASQIAESLTEAFASGEDAAKSFDNTVADILRSLATEAIKLQFIEPAMANLKSYMFGQSGIFTDNSESGTDLSANEAAGLGKELDKLKGQIAASNNYWDKINEAVGGILDDTENAGKDGLSKGVQSVTEDTANLLGSYLNSIRHDSSVQRTLIEQLVNVDVPQMSIIAQAQLQQLQQVAVNTKRNADAADRIYDLVNRVVDKGSNKLKV